VHPHDAVEVYNAMDGTTFQVNGHYLKSYREYLNRSGGNPSERSCLSGLIFIPARDPFLYYSFLCFLLFCFSVLGSDG